MIERGTEDCSCMSGGSALKVCAPERGSFGYGSFVRALAAA